MGEMLKFHIYLVDLSSNKFFSTSIPVELSMNKIYYGSEREAILTFRYNTLAHNKTTRPDSVKCILDKMFR